MAPRRAQCVGHHYTDPSTPPSGTKPCHCHTPQHRLHSWLHGEKAPSDLTAPEPQQRHCPISVPGGTTLQHQLQPSEPRGNAQLSPSALLQSQSKHKVFKVKLAKPSSNLPRMQTACGLTGVPTSWHTGGMICSSLGEPGKLRALGTRGETQL